MAKIVHITQEGYDELRRNGMADKYGIKPVETPSVPSQPRYPVNMITSIGDQRVLDAYLNGEPEEVFTTDNTADIRR